MLILSGNDTRFSFSADICNKFLKRGFRASLMTVDDQEELYIETIEEYMSIIVVFSDSCRPSGSPWNNIFAVVNQGRMSQLLLSVCYYMELAPTEVPASAAFHFPVDESTCEHQLIEDILMKVSEHFASKIVGQKQAGGQAVLTAPKKDLFESRGIQTVYAVEGLDTISAYQVLCLYAFASMNMNVKYIKIIHRAEILASGNPSALKAIGSNLRGKTTVDCETELEQYEQIPNADLIQYLISNQIQ